MEKQPQIVLKKSTHKGNPVIQVLFAYHQQVINKLKNDFNARWSQSMRCWYIHENDFNLQNFFAAFKKAAYINYSALRENNKEPVSTKQTVTQTTNKTVQLPKGYLEKLQQKRYSENTIKIYTCYMQDYTIAFSNRNLKTISKGEINTYILDLIRKKHISPSQQNQRINAIKFYYEKVLELEKQYYTIDRPKKSGPYLKSSQKKRL